MMNSSPCERNEIISQEESQEANEHGDPCIDSSSGSKRRQLQWTEDLHDRFVNAVTKLGGPSSATPMKILEEMGVTGITIENVKSHLQKYRMQLDVLKKEGELREDEICPNPPKQPRIGSPSRSIPSLDKNEGKVTDEAEMEMQGSLQLQNEVERHLEMRMDAERNYMQSMMDRALKILGDPAKHRTD